jgi:hypothetical protein
MISRRSYCLLLAIGALALLSSQTQQVRAGPVYYAYSVQTTDSYTFSGASIGTLSPLGGTSSAQIAMPPGSEAHVGTLDAPQSYVGPAGGRPAENTFAPKGLTDPDYSRGDSLVTSGPFTTANVAESYLSGIGNSTGSGSWSVTAPLTLASSGALTLGFHFSNDLELTHSGLPAVGTVSADFTYTFTVRDSTGATVFTSSPDEINRAASLLSAGTISDPGSGMISITTGTLAAGSYTGSIEGSEHVFISLTPEPSSLVLLGSAAVTLFVSVTFVRRRRAA